MAELKDALLAAGLNAEQVEEAFDNTGSESACACQIACLLTKIAEAD